MQFDYNPTEAKAARKRLKKRHKADMQFLKAHQQPTSTPKRGGLGFKFEKARARHRLKQERREEDRTLRTVAAARRKESDAMRATQRTKQKTEAEQKLRASKQMQLTALQEAKEAKRARLLSEQELRRAQLEPYAKVARGVGRGAAAVGKGLWQGLKALDAKNQEYARAHPSTSYRAPATRARPPSRLVDLDPGRIEIDPREIMR